MPIERIVKFFASLRLTVVLLALAIILVFIGTIAQVDEGLYAAQNRYFRSLFIWWAPQGVTFRIPVFPGGYLVGVLLLVNLLTAHITRFTLTRKKLGLFLIHIGVILLLVGQLVTDMFATESHIRLTEGEARNYSESQGTVELVFVIDATDSTREDVVSIPARHLAKRGEISDPKLPCLVRVIRFLENASATERAPMVDTEPPASNQGIGARAKLIGLAPVTKMDEINLPAAVVEFATPQGTIGSWLVTPLISELQEVTIGGKTYRVGMRWVRHYKPFHLELVKFSHDKYAGTEKPKNFSSRVRINQPDTKEDREVLIYMNNPLRYEGETFYQSSFAPDNDQRVRKVSILQVVRNPGWLTPYVACILVAVGLCIQFLSHLTGFVTKRRTA